MTEDMNARFDSLLQDKSQQQLESLCRGLMSLLVREPEKLEELISNGDLFFHLSLSPELPEHWKRDIISTIHFLREQFNASGSEGFYFLGEVSPDRSSASGRTDESGDSSDFDSP